MSLFPNIIMDFNGPGRYSCAIATVPFCVAQSQEQMLKHRFVGDAGIAEITGIPNGYEGESAWNQPLKTGGMATYGTVVGSGTLVANQDNGINLLSTITGTGSILATTRGIAWLQSALAGQGALTATALVTSQMAAALTGSAAVLAGLTGKSVLEAALAGAALVSSDLTAALPMQASLLGVGSAIADMEAKAILSSAITGTGTLVADASAGLLFSAILGGTATLTPNLIPKALLSSALSGQGTLAASLRGLSHFSSTVQGSGAITAAFLSLGRYFNSALLGTGTLNVSADAKALLACQIDVGARPSAEEIAYAVWMALASAYALPGTMGKKLNDAGGGSSPTDIAAEVWNSLKVLFADPDTMGGLLHDAAASGGPTMQQVRDAQALALTPGVIPEAGSIDAQMSGIASTTDTIETVLVGGWQIVSNQLIYFDTDGTTPLIVFDLFDDTGAPSMERVFKRERV